MDAKQINRIELAWKKWNDKAVGQAEKDGIKSTIEKMLLKFPTWSINWKTGKVTNGQQQQQTSSKATGQAKQKEASANGWSTKEMAEYISKMTGQHWTTKMLRRYLRQMDAYNDGRMTHYAWSGQTDPMTAKILEFVKGKKSA